MARNSSELTFVPHLKNDRIFEILVMWLDRNVLSKQKVQRMACIQTQEFLLLTKVATVESMRVTKNLSIAKNFKVFSLNMMFPQGAVNTIVYFESVIETVKYNINKQ